ncbi:MAG: hypothetical protein ACYDAS_03225 [Patescibacteria group bacterium]
MNWVKSKKYILFYSILFLIILVVLLVYFFHFNKSKNSTSVDLVTNTTTSSPWIFAYSHFNQVIGAPGVVQKLRGVEMYEVLSLTQKPTTLMPVIPTLDFHSYSSMLNTINKGIPSYIKAVIYDNERYSNTPLVEQQNPVLYTNKAISLAHSHNLKIICDYIQSDRYKGGYTPGCDVIGLNTVQQSEKSSTQYYNVVAKIVKSIRSTNKDVPITAGLSSNPRGTAVTAQELDADIAVTKNLVGGYWLNVPAPGLGCPQCHLPQPQIAISMLQNLP